MLQDCHHPATMMAILDLMDSCILERLHSVILASKMNIPFLAVSYDNKVAEYVKLVNKTGVMIDLRDVTFDRMKVKLEDCLDV